MGKNKETTIGYGVYNGLDSSLSLTSSNVSPNVSPTNFSYGTGSGYFSSYINPVGLYSNPGYSNPYFKMN